MDNDCSKKKTEVEIVFKKQVSDNQRKLIIKSLCQDKTLVISSRYKNSQQKIQYLKMIQQLHIEDLVLLKNKKQLYYYQNIYPQLENIRFPQLLSLTLSECKVESIESLSKMDISRLQMLSISKNQVVNLQSIRKIHFVNLCIFSFDKNYIQEWKSVCQIQFGSCMNILGIQDYYPESNLQSNSMNWLAKINSRNLLDLNIRSIQRIMQPSLRTLCKLSKPNFNVRSKEDIGYMVSDGETSSSSD